MSNIVLGFSVGLGLGGNVGYFFGSEGPDTLIGAVVGGIIVAFLSTRNGRLIRSEDLTFVVDTIGKIGVVGIIYHISSLKLKQHCHIKKDIFCNTKWLIDGAVLLSLEAVLVYAFYKLVQKRRENQQHRTFSANT